MKINFLIIGILSMFLMTTLVSGAYTANGVRFIAPTASTTASQLITLNVTNVTFFPVNCTFLFKSASTANSTATSLGEATANVSFREVARTFNTTAFEDANDYIINATCRNLSNDISDVLVTGITIDNTIPTAPSALAPATSTSVTSATTQNFTATVVNSKTTACTYTIARGGATSGQDYASGDASYSGAGCSFTKTFSTTADNGDWYWTITASDGSNTTSSSANFLTVALAPTGGFGGGATQKAKQTTSNLFWIIGIIVAIVLIIWLARRK